MNKRQRKKAARRPVEVSRMRFYRVQKFQSKDYTGMPLHEALEAMVKDFLHHLWVQP